MTIQSSLNTLKEFLVGLPIRSRDRLTLKTQVEYYDAMTAKVGGTDLWENIWLDPSTLNIAIGANVPSLAKISDNGAGSTGVYAYQFSKSATNEGGFSMPIPHNYKEDSSIYVNLHWAPKSTKVSGNVVWELEYAWTNMAGTIGATAVLTKTQTGYTASKIFVASFAAITGTGKDIASILNCRIARLGGDGADTYDDVVSLVGIGITYQIDKMGSGAQWVK